MITIKTYWEKERKLRRKKKLIAPTVFKNNFHIYIDYRNQGEKVPPDPYVNCSKTKLGLKNERKRLRCISYQLHLRIRHNKN